MPLKAEPEGDGLPLYERIYRILRRHLVEGRLPPGLIVGEAAVAKAFGSSRVPAGAALRRLKDEGLLRDSTGRGFLVGDETLLPIRADLIEAGLVIPPSLTRESRRPHRSRIYPEVEHIVAACLPYGRFHLNETLLAEHYGVSRTVAHEVLTQLDRAGLVTRDPNQRWYAGPLTPELLREHFELRWLLEPIALELALPHLGSGDLTARLGRIEAMRAGHWTPAGLERLERDLHIDTVLLCPNSQLRDALRRSELPLIATHDTFQRHLDTDEIGIMFDEHAAVFRHLLSGQPRLAGRALEDHLRRSLHTNARRLETLGPLPEHRRVPFLVQTA